MRRHVVVMFAFAAMVLGVFAATPASAALLTYFGEDLATGKTVPAAGNAVAARNAFLGDLAGGVGTEDFEGFAGGALPPFNISFPGSTGSITASLTAPANTFICGCVDGKGEFATSGIRWLAAGDNLDISFSSPVSAFGFFGTDIGDFGGQLSLTLTGSGGSVTLTIPSSIGGANSNGDLLFFGFIDTTGSYSSIAFGNTISGTEFFGFDDMTIGDLRQVAIPEPAGAGIFVLGLIWLGLLPLIRRNAPGRPAIPI